MHLTSVLLLCLSISSSINYSIGQCFSDNDIPDSESDIESNIRQLGEGSTDFSFNLLRTIEAQTRSNKDKSGLFFSPFSIWSALMATYMGAKGATEIQFQDVLGVRNISKDNVWRAYSNLFSWNVDQQVTPREDSYRMANKLYFQTGTEIRRCVADLMDSELDFANFAEDAEEARSKINQWVEQETQDKIQDLIPSGGVDALTKMVIANAVYFKENWEIQFDPAKTKPRRFTLPTRRDIFVNMMSMEGRFLYGVSDELQCTGLELPYNSELSMLILLPKNRFYGASILAHRLTADKLQNLLYELYPRDVKVSLPKFKLEDQFELGKALSRMGLRTLFDSNQVDLSGFTDNNDLTVDAVYHKSFIDVNEEGTEAAAATAILTSRGARPIGPVSFTADYPFVFIIRDNVANIILFMGTVQKPPQYKRNDTA